LRKGIQEYIEERIEQARMTAKEVESRIRTGTPPLFELSIGPLDLSTKFGEAARERRLQARTRLLKRFPLYKRFSERRIIE